MASKPDSSALAAIITNPAIDSLKVGNFQSHLVVFLFFPLSIHLLPLYPTPYPPPPPHSLGTTSRPLVMPGPGSGTAQAFILTSVGPLSVPVLIASTKRHREIYCNRLRPKYCVPTAGFTASCKCVFFWTGLLPVVVSSSFSLVFCPICLMYTVVFHVHCITAVLVAPCYVAGFEFCT